MEEFDIKGILQVDTVRPFKLNYSYRTTLAVIEVYIRGSVSTLIGSAWHFAINLTNQLWITPARRPPPISTSLKATNLLYSRRSARPPNSKKKSLKTRHQTVSRIRENKDGPRKWKHPPQRHFDRRRKYSIQIRETLPWASEITKKVS